MTLTIQQDVLSQVLGQIGIAQYIGYLFFALIGHVFIRLVKSNKEVAAAAPTSWSFDKFFVNGIQKTLSNLPLALITIYLIARFAPDFLGQQMTGVVAFFVGCATDFFTNLIMNFLNAFLQKQQKV